MKAAPPSDGFSAANTCDSHRGDPQAFASSTKLNFVGSIERQYDDSFAKEAPIGDSLKIACPAIYSPGRTQRRRTRWILSDLQVATQKGVDLTFTSAELSESLDDFSSGS